MNIDICDCCGTRCNGNDDRHLRYAVERHEFFGIELGWSWEKMDICLSCWNEIRSMSNKK